MNESCGTLQDLILCRCLSVGAQEVERAITALGCQTVDEVKKLTGAGMGPCQGLVCHKLVELALARLAGRAGPPKPYSVRPPIRPLWLKQLAAAAPHFKEPNKVVEPDVLWKEEDEIGLA